ncbi:hypothetical protein GOP47_0027389 [Adiantum capillus-veneris]|nr:hypothetical protein GOP47_0027389 [Adiantum capillus-veneris]
MSTSVQMRKQSKKRGEVLWPRMMMKKWLNIKSTGDEFSADEYSADEHDDTDLENESECECDSEEVTPKVPRRHTTRNFSPSKLRKDGGDDEGVRKSLKSNGRQPETMRKKYIDMEELRVAVGTWNVAGKIPPPYLDLKDWLEMQNAADIYVLGFQEIVPLKAGTVFGAEDIRPTLQWQTLIRETLNREKSGECACYSAPPSPSRETDLQSSDSLVEDSEMDNERILIDEETSIIPSELPQSQSRELEVQSKGCIKPDLLGVYRCTERIGFNRQRHQRTNSEPMTWLSFPDGGSTDEESLARPLLSPISSMYANHSKKQRRYVRVASKQMVGIHISVWVKRKLRRFIRNLTVSCVGLGIMGCLGNKGSISVSMMLHETSFCFICTHLSSGEKEGDELHRNADVAEILKRTRFPSIKDSETDVPKTIWGHDRIIWFGDMNYRLNMPDGKARFLVAREDWTALLEKDQLKKELSRGHTFDGWREGTISFAPTYKYIVNSNRYAGQIAKHGEKRRVPAWCDRILWHGKGLRQLSYRREELTLSDHRPVVGVFLAEVEVSGEQKLKRGLIFKSAKVEVEELLWQIDHSTISGKLHPDQKSHQLAESWIVEPFCCGFNEAMKYPKETSFCRAYLCNTSLIQLCMLSKTSYQELENRNAEQERA